MTRYFAILCLCLQSTGIFASPGDTLKVQTFTFGSKQDAVFFFPTAGKDYRKVLMYYTLKCNSGQTPACGEWDYLTYAYAYKKNTGERFELARFITPYGNSLSLGAGFTWIFNVTDYMPLLQDSVRLVAGNWQELLDMKFAFIEGKPVRKPLSIVNVWSGNIPYTQSFEDFKSINLDSPEKQARLKVRITGHGFGGNEDCAEFCAKRHTFSSVTDPSHSVWSQVVWRDNCGQNPVFPQGGTWVYNRANWCPGAPVETYDVENPFSANEWNAQYAQWKYHPEEYTWDGNGTQPYYAMESQVIFYEDAPAAIDATLEEIITPSKNQMYLRLNPDCSSPRIVIKNNGKDTLKTLTVQYGVAGGRVFSYNWKGALAFGQKETVNLPKANEWQGDYPRFKVTLLNPNGKTDEYEPDNTAYSYIPTAPVLPYKIIIYLKTNNVPEQNEYELLDEDGNAVATRKNFTANTVYRDTFTLKNGCYTFRLKDEGNNGLNWWAAPDDGNGVIRIQNETGKVLKSFNSDFGSEVLYNFTTGWAMNVPETEGPKEIILYPNPVTQNLNVDLGSMDGKGTLEVISPLGQVILKNTVTTATAPVVHLDVSGITPGIYFVRFTMDSGVFNTSFFKR